MFHINKKLFITASIIFIVLIVAVTVMILKTTITPQKTGYPSSTAQSNDQPSTEKPSDPLASQKAPYFEIEGDSLASKGNVADAKSLYTQAKNLYQSLHQTDAITKIDAKIATLDQQSNTVEPTPSKQLTTR